MFNSPIMLRIKLAIILIFTAGLAIAGFHGVFAESIYLRPLQILTVLLLLSATALYLRILSLSAKNATLVVHPTNRRQ